jgi:endonuclease-3
MPAKKPISKAKPKKSTKTARKGPAKTGRKTSVKVQPKSDIKAGASAKSGGVRRKSGHRRALSGEQIFEIFNRFHKANPEPKGELNYVNPYTLLVAVVLSAQATDSGVNKATRALFAAADNPYKMVKLGEERVREMVKTIGLYRTKAKNVVALSQRLIDDFSGEVPRSREVLETLPGVGRKTANVVLNIAFGEPTIAIDTHLFRLSNRLPLAPGKTPLAVELGLLKVIPKQFLRHAHHWLILHGRYVCKALRPNCQTCLIRDLCTWPEKANFGA